MYQDIPDLRECPYDSSHLIRPQKFQGHLIKCGKNHPHVGPLVGCPYNGHHRIPMEMKADHCQICPDKPRYVPPRFEQTRTQQSHCGLSDSSFADKTSEDSDRSGSFTSTSNEEKSRESHAETVERLKRWASAQEEAKRQGYRVPSTSPPIVRKRLVKKKSVHVKRKKVSVGPAEEATVPSSNRFADGKRAFAADDAQEEDKVQRNWVPPVATPKSGMREFVENKMKKAPLANIARFSKAPGGNGEAAAAVTVARGLEGEGAMAAESAAIGAATAAVSRIRLGLRRQKTSSVDSEVEDGWD